MTSPYKIKTDCFSSHRIVANYLCEQAKSKEIEVLDLGCDIGFIGTLSNNTNIKMTGVDISSEVLSKLPEIYSVKIPLNLNDTEWKITKKYDFVVFTDVVEHLTSPKEAINKIEKILKPDGILILSLPNVAFIWARLVILLGKFPQETRGIFDQTHFHHFTRNTAKTFVTKSGYKIMEEKFTSPPISIRPVYDILHGLNLFSPELFAYQFIFFCQKCK